jgi:hypothetical protein
VRQCSGRYSSSAELRQRLQGGTARALTGFDHQLTGAGLPGPGEFVQTAAAAAAVAELALLELERKARQAANAKLYAEIWGWDGE